MQSAPETVPWKNLQTESHANHRAKRVLLGILDRCDRHGNCYIRFARTDYSHCGVIYQQLKQEQARAAVLQGDMQSACSADIQCANCAMAVGGFQQSQSRVAQLQRQYKMCVSAAMPMVSRNWTLLPYLVARP